MNTKVEGDKRKVPLLDLNEVYVPRRKRSFINIEKKKQPKNETEDLSYMLEMAAILIDLANSPPKEELEKPKNTRKRKQPLTTVTTTKKPRKKKAKKSEFPSAPEIPIVMRDRIVEMGGYEINLVIQKQLQDTDVNKNHGRLSVPAHKLLFDFATEEETELLSQQENKSKKGIDVMKLDHLLEERRICLKKWKIGSGDVYCLMTHWNSLVEETTLKSGDHLQLYSFRKDDEFEAFRLCFALVKLN